MRIAETPTAYAVLPAARRSHPRVEPVTAVPSLPRHRRTRDDRTRTAKQQLFPHSLPPRGWLVDIYV